MRPTERSTRFQVQRPTGWNGCVVYAFLVGFAAVGFLDCAATVVRWISAR